LGALVTGGDSLTVHAELAAERGYKLSPQQSRMVEQIFTGVHDGWAVELAKLFERRELDRETLCAALPDAWRYKPDNCSVPFELWREMFLAADFTVDGRRSRRPRWPVRLFRGATLENRARLSWTTSLSQANYFATYRQDQQRPQAQVWSTIAPPQYLLARYPAEGEGEYVVDAYHLTIQPVNPSATRSRLSARFPAVRPWG
jgi:hypothetical protein